MRRALNVDRNSPCRTLVIVMSHWPVPSSIYGWLIPDVPGSCLGHPPILLIGQKVAGKTVGREAGGWTVGRPFQGRPLGHLR